VPEANWVWHVSMHDALAPQVCSQFLRFWQPVACEHEASGAQQLAPAHWSQSESDELVVHPPCAAPPSPPPPPVLPPPTETDVHPESSGTQLPSSGGRDVRDEHASAASTAPSAAVAAFAPVFGRDRRILSPMWPCTIQKSTKRLTMHPASARGPPFNGSRPRRPWFKGVDTTEPPRTVVQAPSADGAAAERPEPPPPGAHTVEVGAGTFLLAGVGASGVVGVSPFFTDGLSESVFLRVSVAAGESPQGDQHITWGAGRIDTCLEVPGNYADRNGLRLDVCGGLDGGVTYIASGSGPVAPHDGQTLPYLDVGPSVDLRGDLGELAAISLRGVLGLNVARSSFVDISGVRVDSPVGSARIELDLSFRLR